ncbi:MAG: BamA/TamA family outer membrane protein [Cyclobacteriaceae bacterium]
MSRTLLLIAILTFSIPTVASAQFVEKAIEFFTIRPNKKKAEQDSTVYPSKIVLAPVVIYSPETSIGLGVGAKYLFKMSGSGDETRTSNMPVSLIYTLQNQIVIYSGFEIFSNQERYMLTGNLQFQVFPRFYYGIGRNTPESNEEKYNYTQILVEPILLKRVAEPPLFLGAGIRYNRISNVEPQPDGLLIRDDFPGATGSTSVGAQVAAVFDSRDNLLNANRGWYLELTHGFYGKALGGTHEFQLTRLDFRYYQSLKDFSIYDGHSDVLAFQLITKFTYGEPPLNELAALGSDQIMRGYYSGRYLDRNLVSTQVEYRAQITKRLGAAVFAGVGDVAGDVSDFKFANLRASIGFGLRFLIDEREDLNIRADWGFGNRTNNYYLNVAEAF